jgi:hypothetical protein
MIPIIHGTALRGWVGLSLMASLMAEGTAMELPPPNCTTGEGPRTCSGVPVTGTISHQVAQQPL